MTIVELSYYAGQINLQSWRFSYGRSAIKHRLLSIDFKKYNKDSIKNNLLQDLRNDITLQIDHFIDRVDKNLKMY